MPSYLQSQMIMRGVMVMLLNLLRFALESLLFVMECFFFRMRRESHIINLFVHDGLEKNTKRNSKSRLSVKNITCSSQMENNSNDPQKMCIGDLVGCICICGCTLYR